MGLEQNQELKEEVRWLNDVISHNISEIMKQMDAVREKEEQQEQLNLLQSEQIDSLISEHDEDITSVRKEHAEDITSIRADMDSMKNDLVLDPVGTIIAWTPSPDANNLDHVILPECYVPCDGSEIAEGIWKGRRTPDLNNAKRFLRGGIVSEALMFEEDSVQEHSHTSTVS